MGVAALSKVTVVAPRTDYQEVLKRLSQFRDFHLIEDKESQFDPVTQELAVRAVRLLAQVDQLVKDLSIPLQPGMIDIIFRGVKIPQTSYEVTNWADLLGKAEAEAEPIRGEIRAELSRYTQLLKEELDTQTLINAIKAYSGISSDLSRLTHLTRVYSVVTICPNETLPELEKSLDSTMFVLQPVGDGETMVLLASPLSEASKIEKVLKTLDLKPFSMPEGLGSPSEAYQKLSEGARSIATQKQDSETKILQLKTKYTDKLLAIRELVELAHKILDETRMAGGLRMLATISGYIPRSRGTEFTRVFQNWLVYTELAHPGQDGAPVLMNNPGPTASFSLITKEQGTPGAHEVDPTSLITFVFPIFFGMMFGDLGHGLILTAFGLLVRARATGTLRQWGNIFFVAGVSSCVFGVVFGEFFGFSIPKLFGVPAVLELVYRPLNGQATLDSAAVQTILVVAILIGVAHITTGLSLNIVEGIRGHETVELLTEKIPSLIMYLSGIGFGIAFIGAGYSFNVLSTTKPAPLIGVPNSTLGLVSVIAVVASMIVLVSGKGIAVLAGRAHGESAGSAFANGGIEVFERISAYLANTISYVRLAIMVLIHASLLLIINQYTPITNPVTAIPWFIFNMLVLVFEVLVVYIQDLRLHIYEFFTKFYQGTGKPFVKLVPERIRTKISWLQV